MYASVPTWLHWTHCMEDSVMRNRRELLEWWLISQCTGEAEAAMWTYTLLCLDGWWWEICHPLSQSKPVNDTYNACPISISVDVSYSGIIPQAPESMSMSFSLCPGSLRCQNSCWFLSIVYFWFSNVLKQDVIIVYVQWNVLEPRYRLVLSGLLIDLWSYN